MYTKNNLVSEDHRAGEYSRLAGSVAISKSLLNNRMGYEWVCLGRRRVGLNAEAESRVGVATDANCPHQIPTIHLNFVPCQKRRHVTPHIRFAEGWPLNEPIDND